ncbi:MAG TPA: 50S ribosomal protein L29 [Xenococcaceae cyanobacterium]
MALPKIAEVRKLSEEELAEEILAVKRELFQLRLEQATRRLETPHLFKHKKHRLSQLLTVERERQLNISPEATTTSEAE